MGSAPGFSGRAFRILLDISQRLNSAPPFWDLSIEISPDRGSARHASSSAEFWEGKVGICLGRENSEMRVSDKNGISFAGSETLQMPIAATDFCLSRAERMWDGCDLRDLGSPPLHRNLQKPNDRILRSKRNLLAHFSSPIFFSPFFLLPKLLCWDLGSAVCALVDWDERGAWFVGCSWHTVPL